MNGHRRRWPARGPSLLAALIGLAACSEDHGDGGAPPKGQPGACPDPAALGSDPFADCVVSFSPGPQATFGHDALPGVLLGPPRGGGEQQGGTDVASLGCGGEIVLAFDGPGLQDAAGPDLLVFENAFCSGPSGGAAGSGSCFSEPAEVAVSEDGRSWSVFPCTIEPGKAPVGCAGLRPVLSSPGNGVDPTDPLVAGGDSFDLGAVGLARARYVRLQDRTAELHGASSIYCQGAGAGFDLDALARAAVRK